MGASKQKISATAKLIEQFPYCSLCGGDRLSTTRDHIPPKALFDNSHRPDKLVVPACTICNRTTSTADLIAAIVSRWDSNVATQALADGSRLVARLRKQCPDVIQEWTNLGFIERKRARQHLERHGVKVPLGAAVVSVGELTVRNLNLFAYKLALGLYFEHFREPLPNSGLASAIWRTKEDFAEDGVPAALLELMPRYATLEQGTWNTQRDFEYRYDLNKGDGIFGCLARFRTSLFVTGFAVRNGNSIPKEDRTEDWIRPADLLTIMEEPRFRRRLQ